MPTPAHPTPAPRLTRRPIARAALLLGAAAAVPGAARAQEPAPAAAPAVERPVPFDAAGRVVLMTPALATRLGLTAPAWPVRGAFIEARLFAAGDSAAAGAVLSVSRPGGAIERYALGAAERQALRDAVAGALAAAGPGLRSDTNVVVSEPAGRAFVRNQTGLGFLVYGPAAAMVAGPNAGAAVAYSFAAVGAFASSLSISRQQPVTRAQAVLSSNMGLGVAAASAGLLGITDVEDAQAYGAGILAGGVAGSIMGFRRAAGMTDAEATASGTIAFLSAAGTAGVAGALDAYNNENSGRPAIAASIAALATGYALGPRYARARGYTVTAGDVGTLTPLALSGALLGASLDYAARDGTRGHVGWAGATVGLVAGTLVADRLLVRRYDHTASEADLAQLGTLLGAVLGSTIAGSADASTTGGLFATGLGALGGFAFAEGVLRPAPDGRLVRLRTGLGPAGRLRFAPANLLAAGATAARGGRGTFPVGSFTF